MTLSGLSCGMWVLLPCIMWDLSFLTRDGTCIPCIAGWTPNHWSPGMSPPPGEFLIFPFHIHSFPSVCDFYKWFLFLLSHVWLCDTHGLQHPRLPRPSLCPGACSNSCPSRRWCHQSVVWFLLHTIFFHLQTLKSSLAPLFFLYSTTNPFANPVASFFKTTSTDDQNGIPSHLFRHEHSNPHCSFLLPPPRQWHSNESSCFHGHLSVVYSFFLSFF